MKAMAILRTRGNGSAGGETTRLPGTIGTGVGAAVATATTNFALIEAYRSGVPGNEHDMLLAFAGAAAAGGYGLGMVFTNNFTQNITNKMRMTVHGGLTALNSFLLANDGHVLDSHLPVPLISAFTVFFGARYVSDLNEWRKLRRDSKA